MKRCTRCGKEKPINEFNFRIKALGLRQYQCIECTRALVRSHYERNKACYLIKAKKRNAKFKAEARSYIYNYLSQHPCIDCGESDITVLEFDHREDKFGEVASLIRGRYPLKKIEEEVKKCDVRCANCHRRKTAKEFKWFKSMI